MESDDLSLIEINGVDDDLMSDTSLILIKEFKNPTPTTHTANLDLNLNDNDENLIDFSCSPLQLDRSTNNPVYHSRFQPPVIMKDKCESSTTATTTVNCSSPAMLKSNDKENLNDQNVSLRSPCEDPQQTKRRKKRGGYNLRKSLAWNKAFFTDEGVLDPSELSRLSKPSPRLLSSPMLLSSVAEEGGSSFRKGAKVRGAGLDLNSVRGNLFTGSPKKPPLNEGRRVTSDSLSITHSSTQKAASPITRASRKVQLIKAPSGSVSPGGGCPRPSTLSSQRRLPNTSTVNRTVKDSKIPKPTILKAESSSVSTISKNTAVGSKASKLNRNLPPVTADKSVGLRRGSSLIPEKKANSASSSSSRPYVLHSSKTSVNLSKDKHLSTDLQPPQPVKGTKIGQKTTTHPVLCVDKHNAVVTESRAEVDNPAAHNTNCISEDIPNPQTQPTKITGLRMPSPSLRFFDQPKSAASHSNQSVNAQLSNHRDLGIPIARKRSQSNRVVEPKPLLKLDETSRLAKAETTKVEVNALSSTSKCSVPPAASIASYTKLKPKIEPSNVQVEANVSASMSSFNQTSSQEESYNVNIDVDKQEVKEENTRSHTQDEVGQHKVNLGSELAHTSVCHTSPAMVQRDKHDEVESRLHDVHMGVELSGNQLPQHAGSPEQFQMDNHPEKQEVARNNKDGEVDQIMHEVNLGSQLNTTSPVCHKSPVQVQNDDQLEKRETAVNKKHDDVESILHDVHMGMELSGNQLPPNAGSPEQFQMDNLTENQADARNNRDGEVDQIMHEVNLGSQLNKTSLVCHTSPLQVQNDDQLENREIARDQDHVKVAQIYQGVQMGLKPSDNQLPLHAGSPERFQKDNHLEKQEDDRDYIHDEVDQIMDEVNLVAQLSSLTACPIYSEQEHKDSHVEKQEDPRHHIQDEVDQIMHEVSLRPELNNQLLASLTYPEQNQADDEKQQVASNHSREEVAPNHIRDEVVPVSHEVDMDLDLSDDDLSPLRTGYHGVSQGLEMGDVQKYTCVSIPSIQLGDGDDNSVACTSAANVECVEVAHSVSEELGEVAELINQCPDEPEKSRSEESQEIHCVGSISDVQTPVGLATQLKESCLKVSSIEKILQLQANNSHFETPSYPPDQCDVSQNCCPEDVNKQAEEQLNVGKPYLNELELVLQENHHMSPMKGSTPLLVAEERFVKPCPSEVNVDHMLEINDSTSFLNGERLNSTEPLRNELDADQQEGNPLSEINDSTSPLYSVDQLNDRRYSFSGAEIDLHGGYPAVNMSDSASILESESSEALERDNTLGLPTITRESIVYASMETTYPSGNMCGSLQLEERDAMDGSNIEHPLEEVAAFQCLESKLLAENHEFPCDTPNKYPSEHNLPKVNAGLQSTLKISEDQTANSVATCVTSKGFTDNDLKNCISLEKTHTTPGNSGTPNGELQYELKNGVLPKKSEASTMGSKGNSLEVPNKYALALKYKLNAVPFSDEWLAALEAAGEDILTMKTGAVQNSPPDKSVPEPSPWSPVKRKNQEIGPFDCTKCTNLPAPPANHLP
ncbi:uncharacterized protein LOC113323003 isoform X1 [Papaver somniferum]|uniref:uncharacterized protein LOC113323003 isoform X1 n=1 Tax=Papaver somniferum TaxID=3469 RepID=UPI000E700C46|nr:uncharacterized protein LOC113323003 isoform X1 [Papaver somniferum]